MRLESATLQEIYSIRGQVQLDYVRDRTAAHWVGFFLPHLRSGMSLLDCGCGVGSITLDLARLVAPGQVVGIDIDPQQVELARSLSNDRGIANVRFETGNVYALPFPAASFDAVLAHTLLLHLNDPLRALCQMRRVLRPGGVIGVADDDYGTVVSSSSSPLLSRLGELWVRLLQHNGGSPYYARHLRRLLLEAGFARTEGHAVASEYYGTQEATQRFARLVTYLVYLPALRKLAADLGWADDCMLDSMIAELQSWAGNPDSFLAWMYCAAVGWVERG